MKKLVWIGICFLFCLMPLQANTKEEVTLKKCTDGDTAHFMINGKDTTVRFLAINAPEYTKTKEPYGKEASKFVCDMISNAKELTLEYDDGSDKTDKYGRTLAWVYADGKMVQRELVKEGLAEVKYIYGDYAYTDELRDLEASAKKQKLNMWSDGKDDLESQIPYYVSIVVGIILIIAGIFVKGKNNKKRYIKKGIRQLKKKR